jgi:hypothetical protein
LDLIGAAKLDGDNPVNGRYRLKILPFCVDVVNVAVLRVQTAAEEGQADTRSDEELAGALLHEQSSAEAAVPEVEGAAEVGSAAEEGQADTKSDKELAGASLLEQASAEARIWPIGDDPEDALESLHGWIEEEPAFVGNVRSVPIHRMKGRFVPEHELLIVGIDPSHVRVLTRCLKSWVSQRQPRDIRIHIEGQRGAIEIKADSKAEEQIEAKLRQTLNMHIG